MYTANAARMGQGFRVQGLGMFRDVQGVELKKIRLENGVRVKVVAYSTLRNRQVLRGTPGIGPRDPAKKNK